MQGYLAIAEEARGLVDDAELDWDNDQQARLVVDNLIDALAPTNFPWSNPTVIKAIVDQGGRNLVIGARQFARDMSCGAADSRQRRPDRRSSSARTSPARRAPSSRASRSTS